MDWVIVGGESGPNARPCNVEHVRSIVRQCRDAGVPPFVKQFGSQPRVRCPTCYGRSRSVEVTQVGGDSFRVALCGHCGDSGLVRPPLRDKKGGDPAEWPKDLRVREVPT